VRDLTDADEFFRSLTLDDTERFLDFATLRSE
jgi:hypothetical protein